MKNAVNSANPSIIKEFLIGFCLGTANIIPGVSGGTFLLVFNIYERVFSILSNINISNIRIFIDLLYGLIFKSNKSEILSRFLDFLNKNDFIFLVKLVIGAVIAIISLSSLMKYLITHHFSVTYALFFGLILMSISIPVKMLKQKKAVLIIFILLGAIATIWVTYSVDPYKKAKLKSDTYEIQYLKNQTSMESHSVTPSTIPEISKTFSYIGKYSSDEYVFAAICGAASVSAMVLPGISGSLVLILMGQYFEVVSAISGLATLNVDDILFLSVFTLGMIIGGLLFAKFVSAVLARFYNATMAFLIGLMIGSLYALWPFKKSMLMASQYIKKDGVIQIVLDAKIYTNINVMPQLGVELIYCLTAFIIGCVIMYFFAQKEFE